MSFINAFWYNQCVELDIPIMRQHGRFYKRDDKNKIMVRANADEWFKYISVHGYEESSCANTHYGDDNEIVRNELEIAKRVLHELDD
jgi:hypothetical protein